MPSSPERKTDQNRGIDRRQFLLLSSAFAASVPLAIIAAPTSQNEHLNAFDRLNDFTQLNREKRSNEDLHFYHRVDPILNKNRVNFLLFLQGETHEPPNIERKTIGSQTIVSVNTISRKLDYISWTHDFRAPEIEEELKQQGKYLGIAQKIDRAYDVGGFSLMQKVVESATGLSIDYQIKAEDAIIVDLVNKVTGQITVDNPKDFTAYKIYHRGLPYPEYTYSKGNNHLDGVLALQYIKSVPKEDADPIIEHNKRKYLVIQGLQENLLNPSNFVGLIKTISEDLSNGTVNLDDNLRNFIFQKQHIFSAYEVAKFLLRSGSIKDLIPLKNKEIYLVDWAHGDGGGSWVNANKEINPITKKDIENGVYEPDLGFEVPHDHRMKFLSNPYSKDLVSDYWLPLRSRVAELLV